MSFVKKLTEKHVKTTLFDATKLNVKLTEKKTGKKKNVKNNTETLVCVLSQVF